MFQLNSIIRKNILHLKPYSSARDEYKGKEGVFLDANENPIGSATNENYNRYPDPKQWEVKEKLANLKRLVPNQIFLGNGSDEAIDLVYRSFCEPGIDNVITMPPTYGMYKVCADINNVAVKEVPLIPEIFQIDLENVMKEIDSNTKVIWLCSPNNPTGNALRSQDILKILEQFKGIVVIDEAYADFAPDKSMLRMLSQHPNLIILQTFSKAWGLAALRLGMAFASEQIIDIFNKVKYPYNVNILTQQLAYKALSNLLRKEMMVEAILLQKAWLENELAQMSMVKKVYPSDANFLLVKIDNANKVFEKLIEKQVITRNRSSVINCGDCLRISIGTELENLKLIETLKSLEVRA